MASCIKYPLASTARTLSGFPRRVGRFTGRVVNMHKRFTIDGSPALEQHLQKTCELVLAGIREVIPARKLEGLVLGGGYGRGEGGVLRGPSGDQPYNDLEYYLFLRGMNFLNRADMGRR